MPRTTHPISEPCCSQTWRQREARIAAGALHAPSYLAEAEASVEEPAGRASRQQNRYRPLTY